MADQVDGDNPDPRPVSAGMALGPLPGARSATAFTPRGRRPQLVWRSIQEQCQPQASGYLWSPGSLFRCLGRLLGFRHVPCLVRPRVPRP